MIFAASIALLALGVVSVQVGWACVDLLKLRRWRAPEVVWPRPLPVVDRREV